MWYKSHITSKSRGGNTTIFLRYPLANQDSGANWLGPALALAWTFTHRGDCRPQGMVKYADIFFLCLCLFGSMMGKGGWVTLVSSCAGRSRQSLLRSLEPRGHTPEIKNPRGSGHNNELFCFPERVGGRYLGNLTP